jgi:salicylate hydroxylase
MGDAAQTMTPWQGAGAGQAIEDVMILDTVLQAVREPSQLNAAFRAYDEVRRPRTQQVVASAKITGSITCGRGPGVGMDVNKLCQTRANRLKFIHELDMKEHKNAALAAMYSTTEQKG